MYHKVKCPKCNKDAELIQDEVDIGVGVMTHPLYILCSSCGEVELPGTNHGAALKALEDAESDPDRIENDTTRYEQLNRSVQADFVEKVLGLQHEQIVHGRRGGDGFTKAEQIGKELAETIMQPAGKTVVERVAEFEAASVSQIKEIGE